MTVFYLLLQIPGFSEVAYRVSTFEELGLRLAYEGGKIRTDEQLDRQITGRVTDERGEGLPGVSIQVKGAPRGTTTAVDGTFSILLQENEDVLVFSFVGYLTEEVAMGNRTSVHVELRPKENNLNEVVVIG